MIGKFHPAANVGLDAVYRTTKSGKDGVAFQDVTNRPVVGYDEVLGMNKYVACVLNDTGEVVHASSLAGFKHFVQSAGVVPVQSQPRSLFDAIFGDNPLGTRTRDRG